jgi:glutamate--cysteine ligase
MRGADSGPWSRICALPAFWVGLLYDAGALDAAWDVAKDWSADMRDQLRLDAAHYGLKAKIGRRTVQDVAREVVSIARAGLKARARPGAIAIDETHFLDPLQSIADSGVTMGEFTARHFFEELNADARRLLAEASF